MVKGKGKVIPVLN